MIVQGHGQVIVDQILAGYAQVHGVPKPELLPHLLEEVLRDLRALGHRAVEVDEVPHLVRHVLGLNGAQGAAILAIQSLVLKEVAHGVVRHVDRAVRQGLDDELLVPWHLRAQAERTAARPLLQPRHGVLEGLLDARIVCAEVLALHVVLDGLSPRLLTVLQVPLVDQSDDAFVAAPGHDLLFRLRIHEGLVGIDHLFPEDELCLFHRGAFVGPERHDALVEAQLVADVVRLLKLLLILLRLHAQLLAHVLGGHRSHLAVDLDIDDGHKLEGLNPLGLDAEVVPLAGLHEIHEGGVVVGGVAWNAGDDAGALVHLDSQQRQQVHDVVGGCGALDLATHELLAGDLLQELRLAPWLQDVLEAHVASGAVGAHVDVAVRRLEATVPALGEDPAIRLSGHRLRPQCRSQQEYLLALQGLHALWELHKLDLDSRVLLRADALALSPVVVHARLTVDLGEDCGPLAEADLLTGLQLPELPPDEGVVERIHRGRDE
mmetsp:Transcript_80999/g.234842  ORF Transcript_80999/g.234842 Transcript_80999/m.234842 type:complete len:490 (-) Transcript_80999:1018-2487(-)